MKRTIYLYILGLLTVMTACEKPIPYNGEYEDPKLVIQAQLSEGDSALSCTVSHSVFFLEYTPKMYDLSYGLTLTVTRENGETISVPDTEVADLTKRDYNIPLATPLKAGEVIRIQASHPDYPTAVGKDTIMPKPDYTILSCVWDSLEGVCRVKLRINENTAVHGVMAIRGALDYQWIGENHNTGETKVYTGTAKFIQSKDNLFASLGNAFSTDYGYNSREEMYFKADEARNREVTVEFPLNNGYTPVTMTVQLMSLSSDAYLYRRSMFNYLGAYGISDIDLGAELSSMFGIEETVQLYSNIENGYGIVAGQSSNKQTINLNE